MTSRALEDVVSVLRYINVSILNSKILNSSYQSPQFGFMSLWKAKVKLGQAFSAPQMFP